MPCYQSTNFPPGFSSTGRTSYATEADCLAACKEGACCEGTTCSVQPQCQCQGTGKVFKGVGTVCTPNPCLLCRPDGLPVNGNGPLKCYCYCTAQGGKVPRFINVSVRFVVSGAQNAQCNFDSTYNVTLTRTSDSIFDGVNQSGIIYCPSWAFQSQDINVTATAILNLAQNLEEMIFFASSPPFCNTSTPLFGLQYTTWGFSISSSKPTTSDSSGLCYIRHIGATGTETDPVSQVITGTVTVLGFQE